MVILGINAYHGDSAACVVVDGQLIAAVEEERFRRIKHWAGFPSESIRYCLSEAGVSIEDISHIAVNRDPKANIVNKALFAVMKRPSFSSVTDRLRNASKIQDIKSTLCSEFGINLSRVKAPVHNIEHHIAHMASSYFVSPFDEAAVVSLDGFGDFVGAMWGTGKGNQLDIKHRTFFPHSPGLYYLALTQYLGFPEYGDEYKVMGLSAYGDPVYMNEMNRVLKSASGKDSLFELELPFFNHNSRGTVMSWNNGKPSVKPLFSNDLETLLGPRRNKGDNIEDRHKNIAASMQKKYEQTLFDILSKVHAETGCTSLALAGGCAMNSLANGKITNATPFEKIYIQPAAGDAGGSVGAAYYVWNQVLGKPRTFTLKNPYLGPSYSTHEVKQVISDNKTRLMKENCRVQSLDENSLCQTTARAISEGKVVGWFQGRAEWGPRALGNRSILCDPRRTDMKETLNCKIKMRESFRPFAPSVHLDAVGEFFESSSPEPFMQKVSRIWEEKHDTIPAVTHADGTGRLQTVERGNAPLYWQLIEEFKKLTGIPVLLNTSLNNNEPIVNTPEEALNCFLKTKMDMILLSNFLVTRED